MAPIEVICDPIGMVPSPSVDSIGLASFQNAPPSAPEPLGSKHLGGSGLSEPSSHVLQDPVFEDKAVKKKYTEIAVARIEW